MGVGFTDPLRVKWPRIKSGETQEVRLTIGDDAATTQPPTTALNLTDWTNLGGAVSDGPEDVGSEIFSFTSVEPVGDPALGVIKVTFTSANTRSLQTNDAASGLLDIYGTTPAPDPKRKKLIHAYWQLIEGVGT